MACSYPWQAWKFSKPNELSQSLAVIPVSDGGIRQSLLSTFDHLFIFDLHGNTKKKEKAPDGSRDDNVFDIEQGVAVSPTSPDYLFLRHDSILKKEFEKGITLLGIFGEHNTGVKTHRDHFVMVTGFLTCRTNRISKILLGTDQRFK